MIQGGRGLRFALKAGECLRIFSNLIRQELQGDKAMQLYVLSLVDHAHAAATQLLDDAVVRNGLADHSCRILRGRNWQVDERRGVGSVSKGLLLKKSPTLLWNHFTH